MNVPPCRICTTTIFRIIVVHDAKNRKQLMCYSCAEACNRIAAGSCLNCNKGDRLFPIRPYYPFCSLACAQNCGHLPVTLINKFIQTVSLSAPIGGSVLNNTRVA